MATETRTNGARFAYASFSIGQGDFDPAIWTEYFGITPDTEIRRGQPFITSSSRLSRAPGRVDLWSISSKHAVQSDALDPHISYLITRLQLPRRDLAGRVRAVGATSRFFCFWWNPNKNRIAQIDARLRAIAESADIAIEIDEHPYEAGK